MFGIGFFELLVIAVVALVFIGPKKLPDFMKQAGRFFVQMRRTANDVRSTFDGVVREAENEIRREEADTLKSLLTAKPVTQVKPPREIGHADPLDAPEPMNVEGAQAYQPHIEGAPPAAPATKSSGET